MIMNKLLLIFYFTILHINMLTMSANGISDLSTKELKQVAKLDIAQAKREGRVVADNGSISGSIDSSKNYYRERNQYDLTQLPTQYDGDDFIDNPNTGGLVEGRPWIATVGSFTFYEAFGTTTAITATKYVLGNKIYAESSTYDVPSFQPARVVSNDVQVVNTELRGHTLVVLDPLGDVVTAATQYDTWDTGGAPGASTALANALNSVASGNIVVLVVYDASALTAGVRSAINTGYGSTNSNTWTSDRISHIFIGIKI
jgi:hypothetical protein